MSRCSRNESAFTLLEVMFAMLIFSVAIFSILELSTRSLNIARSLQNTSVDPAMIAAEYAAQEELEEGGDSGTFGDAYPNASWESIVTEIVGEDGEGTGLFQVDIRVHERVGDRSVATDMTVVLFRPPTGAAGIGGGGQPSGLISNRSR